MDSRLNILMGWAYAILDEGSQPEKMLRRFPQILKKWLPMAFLPFLWIVATVCSCESIDRQFEHDSLSEMSSEFIRLRKMEGHFSGGVWNDKVDQWLGNKHQLMLKLSKHFGRGGHQMSEVIQYMGNPDEIAEPGRPLFDKFKRLPEYTDVTLTDSQFLIYHWRGEHDLLFFEIRDGEIIASSWWHAGD